jgi:hypothetical protein
VRATHHPFGEIVLDCPFTSLADPIAFLPRISSNRSTPVTIPVSLQKNFKRLFQSVKSDRMGGSLGDNKWHPLNPLTREHKSWQLNPNPLTSTSQP